MNLYNNVFYDEMKERNMKTANEIMPVLIERLELKSIVDVGCGQGIFLAKPEKDGIDVLGIDGDYVERDKLLIKNFMAHDLTKPLNIEKRFDLACSFEVAEHIAVESAEIFVDTLVRLSDVIAFSAAIPNQGGTGHVNEQWGSYWCELFKKRGYIVSDCLKKIFWNNNNVAALRKQNILLFVKKEKYQDVVNKFKCEETLVDVVHPDIYTRICNEKKNLIKENEAWKTKYNYIVDMSKYISEDNRREYLNDVSADFRKIKFWEMVDLMDALGVSRKEEENRIDCLVCNELEELEQELNTTSYVVFGGGQDGHRAVQLLELLGKKIDAWVDSYRENDNLISPSKFYREYNGQIVIIASRKYYDEIQKDIVRNLKEIGKFIF